MLPHLPKSADGEAQTDFSTLKLTYLRFQVFGASDSLLVVQLDISTLPLFLLIAALFTAHVLIDADGDGERFPRSRVIFLINTLDVRCRILGVFSRHSN